MESSGSEVWHNGRITLHGERFHLFTPRDCHKVYSLTVVCSVELHPAQGRKLVPADHGHFTVSECKDKDEDQKE